MTGQELDLLELGKMPARCLKGENSHPHRDRLVAGRAFRGWWERHRVRISNRRYWFEDVAQRKEAP